MSAEQQENEVEEKIKVADMQKEMLEEAMRTASEALRKHEVDQEIAKHNKKHFDQHY